MFILCQNVSIEDTLFFLICCAASCHCEGPGEEAIQKILGAVLGCIILWTGQSHARNLGGLVYQFLVKMFAVVLSFSIVNEGRRETNTIHTSLSVSCCVLVLLNF